MSAARPIRYRDGSTGRTAALQHEAPSSDCGHRVLLRVKGVDCPGATRVEEWLTSDTPVLEWARGQGAITDDAQTGIGLWADTTDLPDYKMPAFASLGAGIR